MQISTMKYINFR